MLVVPVETVNHNALDYLITARFRFHDCKLRLTAKLTSCQSGRLLWVDQFDEKPAPQTMEWQQEVAASICLAARRVLPLT